MTRLQSRLFLRSLFIVAIFTGMAACSSKDKEREGFGGTVDACVLPPDQVGTLSGRWPSAPIPLSIDESVEFTAEEISAIESAVNRWNGFSQQVHGRSLFELGQSGSPNRSQSARPASVCVQTLLNGNAFVAPVVVFKQLLWSFAEDVIALTTFCPQPDTPVNRFNMAILELNYQNFFVSGQKQPDLESIMVHELGHLLGLNHSCEEALLEGVPDCSDASIDESYLEAVMFPVVQFPDQVQGEIRRDLNANDQGRTNCLYEEIL